MTVASGEGIVRVGSALPALGPDLLQVLGAAGNASRWEAQGSKAACKAWGP
jgi:hypothetical protein